MKPRLVAVLVLGMVALTGCRSPGAASSEDPAGTVVPPPELGQAAGPLTDRDGIGSADLEWWDDSEDLIVDGEPASAGEGEVQKDTEGSGASYSGGTSSSQAPRLTTLATVSDPRGEARGGPGYADLRGIRLSTSGERAVVIVVFDAPIPTKLSQGEVMGLGLDLYTGDRGESEYQLFAAGRSSGWEAYLWRKGRFVKYPGSLRIGDRRLMFEVPWRSLGNARDGAFSAFADWAGQGSVGQNDFSEDVAPDTGRASFTRRS